MSSRFIIPSLIIALTSSVVWASSSSVRDSLYNAGVDSARLGRMEGAARAFEEALRVEPGDARARSQLGYVLLRLGDLKTAEGAFAQAIQDDPRLAEAHNGLGQVYAQMPYRRVDAIRCFQKAMALNRTYVEAQYNLAMTHLGLGNLDAKKAFKEVIRLDPRHFDAYFRAGTIYERHDRDYKAAVSYYEQQIAVNPAHAEARRRLVDAYRKVGRYPDALRMAEELRSQGRRSESRGLLSRALVYLDQRDYERAQQAFEDYLSTLDAREQAVYRDLRWVVGRDEAAAGGAAKEGAVRKYWQWRDPTPLSDFNERLVEHYRRVAHSRERFADGAFPWDRRGDVYVRYGEPDHVGRSDDVRFETDPRVVAVKDRFVRAADSAVGDLLMDLTGSPQGRSRYRRVEVPAQQTAEVRGRPVYPVRPGIRWEYWVYAEVGGGVEFTFTDELGNGRFDYAPVPYDLPLTATRTWQALHGERLLSVATARQPEYARWDAGAEPLSLTCASASFRGERGRSHLEVYWGVPAPEVVSADSLPGRLRQGLALFDGNGNQLVRFREEVAASVTADTGAFVPGRMVIAVPEGAYRLVLQVEDPATGRTQAQRRDVVVPGYGEEGLRLSEVELAASVEKDAPPGRFTKGGLRILPMPSGVFRRGAPVSVYYEVYNLGRDAQGRTSYQVAYTVRGRQGMGARVAQGVGRFLGMKREREEVTITYEMTGMSEVEAGYAAFDMSGAEPGGHTLRITVTDGLTGQQASREVGFKIAE